MYVDSFTFFSAAMNFLIEKMNLILLIIYHLKFHASNKTYNLLFNVLDFDQYF